jgi:hypothetical protein
VCAREEEEERSRSTRWCKKMGGNFIDWEGLGRMGFEIFPSRRTGKRRQIRPFFSGKQEAGSGKIGVKMNTNRAWEKLKSVSAHAVK